MTVNPASPRFRVVPFDGNARFDDLAQNGFSAPLRELVSTATCGDFVDRGIPFQVGNRLAVARDQPLTIPLNGLSSRWLVFVHTTDHKDMPVNKNGFMTPMKGRVFLNERAADYVLCYADGTEERRPARVTPKTTSDLPL